MAAAPGTEMKRTLTMTGLTINAMALIAPGAFLWTTFQAQVVQQNGGLTTAFDMVPGLLFVLGLAFLTAFSYAELSNIYPEAGAGSSYYFAEAAFLEKEEAVHYKFARLAKFIVGWVSHLYYWIYPGIMVGFTAILLVYIMSLFGVTLNQPAEVGAAFLFSAVVGLIAYRGISGSTMTAVVINAIQLTALVGFAILAIAFRLTHPDAGYAHSSVASVVLPHNFTNVLFQARSRSCSWSGSNRSRRWAPRRSTPSATSGEPSCSRSRSRAPSPTSSSTSRRTSWSTAASPRPTRPARPSQATRPRPPPRPRSATWSASSATRCWAGPAWLWF